MSLYKRSIVASGHNLVSETAGLVMANGGNAFDAVVAAGFAAAVAEPALTSLGGGGFLLAHAAETGRDVFFDFFVDVPGKGLQDQAFPEEFYAVTVNFSGTAQDFHIGCGSVAVPGTLKGLLHVHKTLGRMALSDVIAPAKTLAQSHILNEQQAHFLQLLRPIMTASTAGCEVYQPGGKYLEPGDTLKNELLADFLDFVAREGCDDFYHGHIARKIDTEMKERGGLLTYEDMAAFKVVERNPIAVPYRNCTLLTAPEPSMGGSLIGLYFALLEREADLLRWGSSEHLLAYYRRMGEVERFRGEGVTTPDSLYKYMQQPGPNTFKADAGRQRLFSRGTTHVSVADRWGNCASMTCSNGEGSGYFAPGTGVMLNNMMGEDDLHPGGFHSGTPGDRVCSMMSPTLLLKKGEVELVVGSGGSKRIRSAIGQVLELVVDHGRELQAAVDAPRMYLDERLLQIEPGYDPAEIAAAAEKIPLNEWPQKDVYFGGVHCVMPGRNGAGDPRRGGAVVVIEH